MMNFVNRALIILQLLVTIVLMLTLIVLLLFYRQGIASGVSSLLNGLLAGPNSVLTQIICIGLAVIGLLIALLFLFLEFQRPSTPHLKVQEVMGGEVEVTAEAIVHRLEYAVGQLADVTRAHPRIVATKKGNVVDLFMEVETNPDVNVPQKTQEVLTTARQVMEEKMGLKVGKIQLRLDHGRKGKKQKDKADGGRETQPPTQSPQQPQAPS